MSGIFTLQSFAVISNADTSILLLNEIIQPDGYEFIHVTPEQLEEKYYKLFSFPKEQFKSNARYIINDEMSRYISYEFFDIVRSSNILSLGQVVEDSIIFLKRNRTFEYDMELGTVQYEGEMDNEFQEYLEDLILKLRLFNPTPIKTTVQFHKLLENNTIVSIRGYTYSSMEFNPRYSVSKKEISQFKRIYGTSFKASLVQLAISNFSLSYQIVDKRAKVLVLMICLESLFNQGKDQISHTISRHLAIIMSTSLDEFRTNYTRIKKLYSMRSDIVHGNKDINPYYELEELEEYVRKAIIFCSGFGGNKKELFEYLNAKGF
jgi:hypothetical protein